MLRCPLDLDRDAAVLEQRTHFLFLPVLETELQIVYLLGKTSRLQPSYTPGSPLFFFMLILSEAHERISPLHANHYGMF